MHTRFPPYGQWRLPQCSAEPGSDEYVEQMGSSTLNRGRVRLQRKRGSRHTSSWHAPQHNQERRIVMDPTTVFCPNLACPAIGQRGQGNIGIHSQKGKRFLCTACRKAFTTTKGTALYRLRTAADTVALVVTLMAHGCPLQAIVVAFRVDERTVAAWVRRAGVQGQAVEEHLVEPPRDLGQVQADEIRVKKQGGGVWMALAMMVRSRLWLAGEVSEQRDMTLIRRVIERVRRCAAPRPLLVCTDGLVSYIRAIRETFRDPVHTGTGGRPRLRRWRHVCIAQVVTRYVQRRVRRVGGPPRGGAPRRGRV